MKPKRRYLPGLLPLLFLLVPVAAQALRCDGRIVKQESRPSEVRALCGDPQGINRYTNYKIIPLVHKHKDKHRTHSYTDYITVPVEVEEWTYNFGPQNLRQRLWFENGILQDIQSLNYGD